MCVRVFGLANTKDCAWQRPASRKQRTGPMRRKSLVVIMDADLTNRLNPILRQSETGACTTRKNKNHWCEQCGSIIQIIIGQFYTGGHLWKLVSIMSKLLRDYSRQCSIWGIICTNLAWKNPCSIW